MLYRWNQVDPQSAIILKWLVAMLCIFLFEFYWRSHPSMALTAGLCVGVLMGQIIPPRLSWGRLIIAVSGALVLGTALTMLHR
jgi:Na+-translocating ferredoxin:NAD+ oxidoreductase RnfD subunit